MQAINPSGLWKKKLGDWAVNPYLGCEHACKFCYVPTMPGSALFSGPVIDADGVYHDKPPARTQRDWGSYIFLKAGFVEALQRQLKTFTPEYARDRGIINRVRGQVDGDLLDAELADKGPCGSQWFDPGWILVSFLTDCYTPLEGKFKVTRQVLKLLLEAGHKVRIQTRSAMVERDFDLLRRFPGQCLLGTSIPYLDDDIARVLEPRSSSPTRRLQMLNRATSMGIPIYIAIAPVLPLHELATNRPLYRDTFETMRNVYPDAREIFCEVLNPKGDNIDMMKEALLEGWRDSSGDVSKKLAAAFVDMERYDEERWASFTAEVLTVGSRYFSQQLNASTSQLLFVPWPDTSRRWAKHLHPRDAEILDGFLPPKTDLSGRQESRKEAAVG